MVKKVVEMPTRNADIFKYSSILVEGYSIRDDQKGVVTFYHFALFDYWGLHYHHETGLNERLFFSYKYTGL